MKKLEEKMKNSEEKMRNSEEKKNEINVEQQNLNNNLHSVNPNKIHNLRIMPIQQQGVYKYEIKINKIQWFIFGVKKSGLVIPNEEYPGRLSYAKDSMIFHYNGCVCQNGNYTPENQQMKTDDTVAIEVNMNSNPRTAILFINNKQQPVFVSGLPESVQFYFTIFRKYDSVTAISLKQLTSHTPTTIQGAKEVKWA
ncbi:MAG: hypothetical protein EZS28_029728 [Streblomastix strix]|uniref:SPRY domain-containing protein n=1 Tax=Streblomastix strix TaxID=222440 RepID=A0A5J4UWY8_9EUKA|nr:MAG: hypothetical protein EZS28_029728 [Streblomastix strix]